MLPITKEIAVGDLVVNTLDRSEIGIITKHNVITEGVFRFGTTGITIRDYMQGSLEPQHLYITSNDEIKENDHCYHEKYKLWCNIHGVLGSVTGSPEYIKENYRKIIASTDPTLKLPGIPEQFLQDYCKAGGIAEVEVLYDIESVGRGSFFEVLSVVYGNVIDIVGTQPVAERTFTEADMKAAWQSGINAYCSTAWTTFEDWLSNTY
jgi:hypothetical protein